MKLETKTFDEKMKKSIAALQSELEVIRAGQANPQLVNRVSFEYYGAPTPISNMADVKATDAKTVTITPYDPSTLKAMERAILASDIGITPASDGKVIRLAFPQPTEERRRELVKQVQKMGEEAKVAVRNIRRDANELCKKMKKDSEMTEDEQKLSEKAVQDLTDKYIKLVDDIVAAKSKDIMSI